MWYVAQIVAGVPKSVAFETGRRVCISRSPSGSVQVIGVNSQRAIITPEAARKHLRTIRMPDGSPVPVRNQSRPDARWNGWR